MTNLLVWLLQNLHMTKRIELKLFLYRLLGIVFLLLLSSQQEAGAIGFTLNDAYVAVNDGGVRRIYLNKINGVLSQNVFVDSSNKPLDNTVFVIQQDYEISGSITIPDNCILEFDGGSIRNGKLVGNNTEIVSRNNKVFNNVTLSGIWTNDTWHIDWFETNSLSNLVNMLVSLEVKGKKTLLFHKGSHYTFSHPIVVYGKNAITLDFNGCIVEDSIKKYYQASYNSFIYVSNSSNISIKNINYIATDKNTVPGKGGYSPVIIRLGDGVYSLNNIDISNVTVLEAKDPSKMSLIDICGDTYNCVIERVLCYADLRYGINCEYGKYENRIKYPHNITIRDVVGNNMTNCLGLLRASCARNILFENCIGHNVQCFIDIWSGDSGSDGSINNVSFVNCVCDYDIANYMGIKEPIIIDNNRRSVKEHTELLMYPIALSFTNCHIIKKGSISDGYALTVKDTQAPISFNNCVIKGFKHAANIDYSRQARNPVIYDGYDNNISFSHCFIDGQIYITRSYASFIDCYLNSNGPDDYLIKATDAARVLLQANTLNCDDRDACVFLNSKANSGIFLYNRFVGTSNAFDLNVRCVIDNNIYNNSIGKVSFIIDKDINSGDGDNGSFGPKIPNGESIGYCYFNTTINKPVWWDGNKWIEQDGATAGVKRNGPLDQKPRVDDAYAGFQYYNTDTHMIIVLSEDGKWFNPDGAEASR